MQIAQVIGGYTLGGADLLRRAMGKKKPTRWPQQRDIFVAGAREERPDRARRRSQLFDLMEKFAGYGFNKSHAAAYALLAYQTAYLKAHHAAAFMRRQPFGGDGRHRQGAASSTRTRSPTGWSSCRPTSTLPSTASSRWTRRRCATAWARCAAPASRRSPRCSRRARTARSRACTTSAAGSTSASSTGASSRRWSAQARLIQLIRKEQDCLLRSGRALEAAEQAERQASQNSLFGETEAPRGGAHVVVEAPAWDLKQKLMEEKAALGFTLSGHLFSVYEGLLFGFPRTPLARAGGIGRARSGWPARSPRCAAR